MPRIYTSRTDSSAYRAYAREQRKKHAGQLVRWFFCGAAAVLLCLFEQTSFTLTASGRALIPFLLPAWIVACALYAGPCGGAWFGLFSGFLTDAAGGASVYLHPILFMAFGLCAGMLGNRILRRGFFVYLAFDCAVCVLYAGFRLAGTVCFAWLLHTKKPDSPAVLLTLLADCGRDALLSVLWSLPLYFPARAIFAPKKERNPKQGN